MSKNDTEALAAFAALNPVPAERLPGIEISPERERTYQLIMSRVTESPPGRDVRRSRPRLAALALAFGVTLAIPALALSGQLGSLFGFSNQGTNVATRDLELRTASALDATGVAPGTLKLLASRSGVGIYAGRSESGGLCYFVGPPQQPDQRGLSGGCMNAMASASFPSPERPLLNMTAFVYKPGSNGEGITRLAGVAADGVAEVQVLGENCVVIAAARVSDNVFVNTDVPDKPAVGIQAVDANGNRVYLEKLRFWKQSACAGRSLGNG